MEDFGRIIDRYTRAEAIADGVLIDVTTTANEAGLRLPTAITAALNADIHAIPPFEFHQDPEGRLWDVLRVGHARILAEPNTSGAIDYDLVMQCGRRSRYRVRMLLGTGDTGEAVLTIMKPDED